jgi:hypothetical protein
MSVLLIDRVDVADGRLEAVVRVSDPAYLRTSAVPGLPDRLLSVLPGLERHRCENDAHRRFRDELADTETPHLLEHVSEELMALAGSPRWLKGETVWDFGRDGRGVFHLVLAYDDDLVALGSLKEGSAIVDWLFGQVPRVDLDAAVHRLRDVRRLP